MDNVEITETGDGRRIFTIDVDNLLPEEVVAFLEQVKENFKNKKGE
jgi:hypothetical protein